MLQPKPYDLVRVKETVGAFDFVYTGQAISYPTDEDLIMVRRVPGDPSTMFEASLDQLQEETRKLKYIHYARLTFKERFMTKHPDRRWCWFTGTDMLRYDSAAPVSFTIEDDDMHRHVAMLREEETDFIIARMSDRKSDPWTHERWSSFWITVEPLKVLKLEKGQ